MPEGAPDIQPEAESHEPPLTEGTAKELARFAYYLEEREPHLVDTLYRNGIEITCDRYGKALIDIERPEASLAIVILLEEGKYTVTAFNKAPLPKEATRKAINLVRRVAGKPTEPVKDLVTRPLTEKSGRDLLDSFEKLRHQ